MGKGFFSSAKSFVKNVAMHTRNVVSGEERAGEALARVGADSRKLGRALAADVKKSESAEEAHQLLKKGRAHYNKHDYDGAERCFRKALELDSGCTLACTYLGHTLYKLHRHDDALKAWKRAYRLDPSSEAGIKALQKLKMISRRGTQLLADLEDQLDKE